MDQKSGKNLLSCMLLFMLCQLTTSHPIGPQEGHGSEKISDGGKKFLKPSRPVVIVLTLENCA